MPTVTKFIIALCPATPIYLVERGRGRWAATVASETTRVKTDALVFDTFEAAMEVARDMEGWGGAQRVEQVAVEVPEPPPADPERTAQIDPALAHSNIPMIAADFAARLLTEMGATNLSRAIIANRNDQSSLSCATHDYCDANMVMDATLAAHNVATDAPDGATADEETAFVIRRADLFNAVWCYWQRATVSDPTFGIRDRLITVNAWLTDCDNNIVSVDADGQLEVTGYPIIRYLCDDNLVYVTDDGKLEVFEGALQTPRLPKCARLLA